MAEPRFCLGMAKSRWLGDICWTLGAALLPFPQVFPFGFTYAWLSLGGLVILLEAGAQLSFAHAFHISREVRRLLSLGVVSHWKMHRLLSLCAV